MNDYSLKEFQIDMAMLNQGPVESASELYLAAELGKMLLERNEQLENILSDYQEKIREQEEEIRTLSKQTRALNEVNDSRLKIYEQLEINIEDLERTNYRLAVQNNAEREQANSLKKNMDNLEMKCSEMQLTIDALTKQLQVCEKKSQVMKDANNTFDSEEKNIVNAVNSVDELKEEVIESPSNNESNELELLKLEISDLLAQLDTSQALLSMDQSKIRELEEELNKMTQKNCDLEDIISTQEVESITSSEVYPNRNCFSCIQEPSLFDEIEEDDSLLDILSLDNSFNGGIASTSTPPKPKANLYKELIEKYEALLELHSSRSTEDETKSPDSGIKLQSPTYLPSNNVIQIEQETQTDLDLMCKFGAHKILVFDASKDPKKSICRHPKYKQLFRDLLVSFVKETSEESAKHDKTFRSNSKTTTSHNRSVDSTAEPLLVAEQNKPTLKQPRELNEKSEKPIVPAHEIKEVKKPAHEVEKQVDKSNVLSDDTILIPYVRKPIEEFITPIMKRRNSRRKQKQTKCLYQTGSSSVKIVNEENKPIIPIQFYYESYRRSPAAKTIHNLMKLETNFSTVLKKSEHRLHSKNSQCY